MENERRILEFCLPANFVEHPPPAINLSEKYPGYRIIDRNSDDYQMEAFYYTCAILLFYTLTTGAFMVKFILQSREPWENADTDGTATAANAYLAHLAKLREREMHKRLVERQARHDVKLRVINHLNQISNCYSTVSTTVGASTENVQDERKRGWNPTIAALDSPSIRSGSDGLIDARPVFKYFTPNGYAYQPDDRQQHHSTAETRDMVAQSSGHSLLLPLWVPARWKRGGSVGSSNQSSWRCTPSPQLSACAPRLSPRIRRRDSMDGGDDALVI